MQLNIDDARRQAERVHKQFSDPAKAQAMREQAEAIRKSLQEQQQSSAKRNAQRTDDLESELGLGGRRHAPCSLRPGVGLRRRSDRRSLQHRRQERGDTQKGKEPDHIGHRGQDDGRSGRGILAEAA